MKSIITSLIFLTALCAWVFSQDIILDGGTGTESGAIESVLKGEAMPAPNVDGLDLNMEVNKGQQQLLEQLRQNELQDKLNDKIQEKEIDRLDMQAEKDDDEDKIINIRSQDFLREISESTKGFYGYDLFYTSRGFKMESSLTAYSDYQIGPGDELVIAMWGDVELRNVLKVSNEGTVYVNNVGLVSVNGLKLDELENKLKKLLSKAYITLDPPRGEASTYLDVSLAKLRPITVFLVGEVFKRGALKLDSYSTVFTALFNSGGPTAKGSLRNVQVIRNGKVISTIDIYDYILTGNKVNDIILKNGDNILVPPRYSSVKLEGEVNTESIYELNTNETIADLIRFSGGLRVTATIDRFQVERIVPFEKRQEGFMHSKEVQEFRLGTVKDGRVTLSDTVIKDGDIVTIFPISNILINYVNISGPVLLPGKYALGSELNLGGLLEKAGGLLPEAYLKKAHVTRIMPDLKTRLFDIDLSDPSTKKFRLESSDAVRVYSIWELITKNEVTISGHVKYVGTTNLDQGAKISDLIQKAGGLEDEVFRNRTYLERADLIRYNDDGITTRIIPVNLRKVLEGDITEDIVLQNRDHLKVYDINVSVFPKSVSIRGLVRKQGEYTLQTNMRVEDLILQAGGLEKGAYYYEAEVFRVDPYNIRSNSLVSVHKVPIDQENFKAGNKSGTNNFVLQDLDLVVIRQYPDYQMQRNVTINGMVKFPGTYSLTKEKETLSELIDRAGGLKNEAFTQGISFMRGERPVLSNFERVTRGSSGGKLVLRHGDVITVPKHPGTVMVEGFVYSPGLVNFDKGWSLNRYIEAAGGIMVDDEYEKGEVVVYYPGGAAKIDGWFFSPSVKEGSRIVVKRVKKPEPTEGMSVREWLSVLASIVSISYYLAK
jgi:polysaccharide biosynthesis/export protein